MVYAGFWHRFGAFWADFIVLIPLIAFVFLGISNFRLFHLYWFLPGIAFGLWFHVYLVTKYGGTPGKLLLDLRIVMLDGSPVTLKAALLRYSVLFVLATATSIAMAIATLRIADAQYLALAWGDKTETLMRLAPSWLGTVQVLEQLWIWSEFITMLFNKKRRAIHDYIAGTVVIRVK